MTDQEYDNDAKEVYIPPELTMMSRYVEAITIGTDVEKLMGVRDAVKAMAAAIRHLNKQVELAMINWIDTNGEITVGEARYYVGITRKTKAKNNSMVYDTLIQELQGDQDAVMQCMSANPWKPGGIKKLLNDDDKFGDLFDVTIDKDLKTGKA